MIKKYVKFVLIKLILVVFASVGSFLAALLLSMTLPKSSDAVFSTVMTGIVPALVFFAFIYSFESKIKAPEGKLSAGYIAAFAARETLVYAVFLIPISLLLPLFGENVLSGGAVSCFLRPHTAFYSFGLPLPANAAAMLSVYFAVSAAAHLRTSKKPVNPAETDRSSEEKSE